MGQTSTEKIVVSMCCQARVEVKSSKRGGDATTNYHQCMVCKRACDVLPKPVPSLECSTCHVFWTRKDREFTTEIVPISVTSPTKRTGLMKGRSMVLPEYRHLPCYEKNPANGKMIEHFHDEWGRRVGV